MHYVNGILTKGDRKLEKACLDFRDFYRFLDQIEGMKRSLLGGSRFLWTLGAGLGFFDPPEGLEY